MHDDPDLDDVFADESEDDDGALEDENAHTLSIRRANGEEVVTIFSPNEEWSVYLQPGGGMTNALVGTPSDPIVWVNAIDRGVERDEDGTYVMGTVITFPSGHDFGRVDSPQGSAATPRA